MKKQFALWTILFATFTITFAQQPGDLDPTFGDDGIVMTRIGSDAFLTDIIENITVQPDGKIVAVGSSRHSGVKRFAMVRYNTDGSLDNTFANNGIFLLNPYNIYGNFVMDARVLNDGKIMGCGRFYEDNSRPVFIKLLPNGQPDPSFGNGSFFEHNFGSITVFPDKFVIQSDGKMVVAGYYADNLMTVRFNADGSLDTSYGTDGFCIFTGIGTSSYAKWIDIQEDNKVVVAGFSYQDMGQQTLAQWLIVRVNEDGTPDATFGDNGAMNLSFGSGHEFATAIAVQPDGKIVVGGHIWNANNPILNYKFNMIRLNADGSFDQSFANSGVFRSELEVGAENYINDIEITPAGNIYAAISTVRSNTEEYKIGVLCLTPTGSLNTQFGEGGYKSLNINGSTNTAKGLVRQLDGKIVLAGEVFGTNSTGTPFGLARFIPVPENNTAVNEAAATTRPSLFPNPATHTLTVQTTEFQQIEVLNVLGQVLYQTNANGIVTIPVSNWDNGVYLVRASGTDGVTTQKFIKQ